MPRRNYSEERYKREYLNEQKYIKGNYSFVNVQFNKNRQDEMELYEWLNKRPTELGESKALYIKRLIKEDKDKSGI